MQVPEGVIEIQDEEEAENKFREWCEDQDGELSENSHTECKLLDGLVTVKLDAENRVLRVDDNTQHGDMRAKIVGVDVGRKQVRKKTRSHPAEYKKVSRKNSDKDTITDFYGIRTEDGELVASKGLPENGERLAISIDEERPSNEKEAILEDIVKKDNAQSSYEKMKEYDPQEAEEFRQDLEEYGIDTSDFD